MSDLSLSLILLSLFRSSFQQSLTICLPHILKVDSPFVSPRDIHKWGRFLHYKRTRDTVWPELQPNGQIRFILFLYTFSATNSTRARLSVRLCFSLLLPITVFVCTWFSLIGQSVHPFGWFSFWIWLSSLVKTICLSLLAFRACHCTVFLFPFHLSLHLQASTPLIAIDAFILIYTHFISFLPWLTN